MIKYSVIKAYFYNLLDGIRFGKLTTKIVATAGDRIPSEIEYIDKTGTVVGYWAYGCFDPAFPYPTHKNKH